MENPMSCSTGVTEINADLLYTCTTTLTGVKDRSENQFYFRCVDNSNNTMEQSYPFTLIGTQPLDILTVGPNGTIAGSTSSLKISYLQDFLPKTKSMPFIWPYTPVPGWISADIPPTGVVAMLNSAICVSNCNRKSALILPQNASSITSSAFLK